MVQFKTSSENVWGNGVRSFVSKVSGWRLSMTGSTILRRGIFQGDCLSPLWFCLALNPLSSLLESSETGFQFRREGAKLSHLFYMADLKLLAPNATLLHELLNITTEFSNSIGSLELISVRFCMWREGKSPKLGLVSSQQT
ncbi:jg18853 [Pararge aegeria aegeria]|uniref:Jg18853 protein n=1 Tax=Pararge aegeria aegeria TaxID=348720 RepID=A0A8S4QZB3_9NEOP|nr:jg18853 [Pararge aegeria aegeria]